MLLTFGCFYESHITGKVSYQFPANQAWGNHVHVLERSVRAGKLWYEEMIIEFRLINLPNFLNFSVSSVYFLFYSEAATGGVLLRKDVLRNIAKFTGKQLCRSLYFNKVVGVSFVFTRCSVFLIEKKLILAGNNLSRELSFIIIICVLLFYIKVISFCVRKTLHLRLPWLRNLLEGNGYQYLHFFTVAFHNISFMIISW